MEIPSETREDQDLETPQLQEGLSPHGIQAMQGEVPDAEPPDQPTQTVEALQSPEPLQNGEPIEASAPLEPDSQQRQVSDAKIQEIGYQDQLADFWRYQGGTNDCALFAQGGVLEANGKPFDIQMFREQGVSDGWYHPDEGTDANAIGTLLEENGVPVEKLEQAGFEDLAQALNDGKGVVAPVDVEPIWGEPGGHALWVTGIDVDQTGKPNSVICNDSGREDGKGIAYPIDQFAEAWAAAGNRLVITKNPLAALQDQ